MTDEGESIRQAHEAVPAMGLFNNFDDVLKEEHRRIAVRRQKFGLPAPTLLAVPRKLSAAKDKAKPVVYDTVGLALSGGGIRSAAICMGAVQVLAKRKVLERIDYLSTVSGGGYTGAAVTLGMRDTKGVFPFVDDDEKRDTPAMQEFRQNANYLRFGQPARLRLQPGRRDPRRAGRRLERGAG